VFPVWYELEAFEKAENQSRQEFDEDCENNVLLTRRHHELKQAQYHELYVKDIMRRALRKEELHEEMWVNEEVLHNLNLQQLYDREQETQKVIADKRQKYALKKKQVLLEEKRQLMAIPSIAEQAGHLGYVAKHLKNKKVTGVNTLYK
jgi:hypothetical protein